MQTDINAKVSASGRKRMWIPAVSLLLALCLVVILLRQPGKRTKQENLT